MNLAALIHIFNNKNGYAISALGLLVAFAFSFMIIVFLFYELAKLAGGDQEPG